MAKDRQTIFDTAAAAGGLAGDLTRLAKSIEAKIAAEVWPSGCTLDRVDAEMADKRCVVTVTITIDAND